MKMKDPKPTFSYLVSRVSELYPELSYLHVVEARFAGDDDGSAEGAESSDFLREIWSPKTYVSAGGYTRQSAMRQSDETGELIAFGRMFISNVSRFLQMLPLL
jgi:NADPH2 dehydrogenase